MVPPATFTSYYGRPIVKAAPWEIDIPAYMFLGGLAAGSSLLAAGADLGNLPELRRVARIGAVAGVAAGTAALIHDLGKPTRFLNMLRTAKPTSPMSMGTWILAAYAPLAGAAAAGEIAAMLPRRVPIAGRLLGLSARPAGLAGGHAGAGARRVHGSAALQHRNARRGMQRGGSSHSSSRAPPRHPREDWRWSPPALSRRRRRGGWEWVEPWLHWPWNGGWSGAWASARRRCMPGRRSDSWIASRALTIGGALGAVLLGGRNRGVAQVSGAALVAGSLCTRLAIFEAGQELGPRPALYRRSATRAPRAKGG